MKFLKQIIELFKKKEDGDLSKEKFPKRLIVVSVLFLIGTVFLLFPSGDEKKKSQSSYELDISEYRDVEEKRLNTMLSSVKGVEKAYVYITYSDNGYIEVLNEEKVVIKKEGNSDRLNETQTEKNPVYNNDNNTVVKKRHTPTVSGVCIFYKGDDNEKTRDRLFRAAKGALGTESHKIEIVLLK